jgi:hypothetical protein
MAVIRTGAFVAAIASLALAGCQSERFSPYAQPVAAAPAPLPAAPAGTVTTGQLPPPVQPGMSEFPAAPGTDGTETPGDTQMASLGESAPEISAGGVAGVWNASVSGQSCRIATPQTRFGAGYRAGPLRCPAPLDGVKSWNVSGNQLSLYDEGGNALAQLYSAGSESFQGQTSSGQPVSLSR